MYKQEEQTFEPVFNLEVEGDHTYYANDVLVHNCMSCVNMHGSEHTLDEVLNDHHAGRCGMLPLTRSYRELGFDVPEEPQTFQRGEDYFRTLSAAEQRERMGGAMFEAWRSGAVDFSELSTPYADDVYGEMLREASLKGVLGEQAKSYYGR